MFERENIKDIDIGLKLIKGNDIEIAEIPNCFIDNVDLLWDGVSTMKLSIPNKIMQDGEIVKCLLYDKIKGKRQQAIGSNKRWVIKEITINESKMNNGTTYKIKEIFMESFESTLGDFIVNENLVRQLYKGNDSTDISDGYLELMFNKENNPYWKIGYVSDEARREWITALVEYSLDIPNGIEVNKVEKRKTIWEKDVNINPIDDKNCMNLIVNYSNVKTYNGDKLMFDDSISNKINNIHAGIRHIKVYYDKNTNTGTYDMFYELTLADKTTVTKSDTFTYCEGLKLKVEKIGIRYTTGESQENYKLKYRNLELGTYKTLDLLRGNLSTAFDNLYFDFNTIKKEVNVYLKSELNKNKGIWMGFENDFMDELSEEVQADNIISKLYINSDMASISDYNKYGMVDYIYNYKYFFENGIATDELIQAWNKYESSIVGKADELRVLRIQSDKNSRELTKLESERTALDKTIQILQLRRTDYIANNKDGKFDKEITDLSTEINENLTRFETILSNIEKVKSEYDKLFNEMKEITKSMEFKNATLNGVKIFNSELLQEIYDLTVVGEVEDTTYVTGERLYNYWTQELELRHTNYKVAKLNAKNFLNNVKIPDGKQWDFYLSLGDKVYTKNGSMRITDIKLNPKNNILEEIVLSEIDVQPNDFSPISNVVNQTVRGESYINRNKQYWRESATTNQAFNKIMGEGMDLMALSIRSNSNRVKYSMTEAGFYTIDAYDENKQIYIGGGFLSFSNDKWNTAKTAIDYEGIIAKEIYGKLFVGEKLIITTELGDFLIGNVEGKESFGLQIKEGNFTRIFLGTELENGVRRAKLVLYDPSGNDVVFSDEGFLSEQPDSAENNVDTNAPLHLKVRLRDNVTRVKESILYIQRELFRCYSKGLQSTDTQVKPVVLNGGGGYADTITSGAQKSYNGTYVNLTGGTYGKAYPMSDVPGISAEFHLHDVAIDLDHFHSTRIEIPKHNHPSNPITIEGHTHPEDRGCFDILGAIPININVFVNGVKVNSSPINSDTEINITKYLQSNKLNDIEITTEGYGRIYAHVYTRSFIRW